ncbi:MAG: response regulator [Bdellovibrionales bacterium]
MHAHTDGKVNILIVDDRAEGLMALEAVLSSSLYNIVRASSGKEALARVLKYDFAVILMDVQMPDMDGFETVHVIKQREKSKDIPVIFLTAISKDQSFVHQGYRTGAVDYIFKPFDPVVLSAKVAMFVDLYMKNQKIRAQAAQLRDAEQRERSQQLATLQLESLNRYRLLADAIPHIIWKFLADGTLEYCNRLWQNYSGLTLEQSSGKGWQTAVFPEDLGKLLKLLYHGQETREPFETECRLLGASDNFFRWHMFRAVPEFLPNGEVSAWIVTNTDIEDRKKIEIDLIRAKEEAAAASQAKSAFLANMSHEIRTPLGIVLGFAELLANSDTTYAQREEYLLTLKRNGELLSRLIGDILDLSKVEAGHLHVEKVQFSLPDFLRSANQSFEHQASEKHIRLTTHLKGPIPTTITSDPMRLRQILFNVVSNAIKFTEQGEVRVEVEMLSLEPELETLQITVTDEGLGITQEQARKLFQPFIQADNSTTRRFGGTGLGLSLSRRLARRLEGDVVLAERQPSKGSAFAIRIGTGRLEGVEMVRTLDAERSGPVAPNKNARDRRLEGVKVLVVEDAPENQFLLRHFLTSAGATVTAAENGQEGANKALQGDFDVVLMDIQMPVLDGYKATRKLREQDFKKPILALTAYALKEERDRCIAAGCNHHLTKPINREELLKSVARYSHKEAVV